MQTFLLSLMIAATSALPPVAQEASARQSDAAVSAAEAALRKSIEEFSTSMLEDGFGWEGQSAFLHQDFTRSYNGGATVTRDKHIAGIRSWWEAGNRVHKSERDIGHLHISDNVGIVRMDIVEHHVAPTGAITEAFAGHVSQVWVRSGDGWELLSNEVISRQD